MWDIKLEGLNFYKSNVIGYYLNHVGYKAMDFGVGGASAKMVLSEPCGI